MPIKHAFVSGKSDPGDSTLVKPSNWNADHNAPPFVVPIIATGFAEKWWDQPPTLTEWSGDTMTRVPVDMTYVSEARLTCSVKTAGATNAKLRIQYSTDSGSTWNYLDGASGPSVAIGSTGVKVSSWVALAAGAKADVWVRLAGIDGDWLVDPEVGAVTLQLR